MTIATVGIIGAGQMGNGIAHVCSLAGINVRLNDISEDRITSGLATINGSMARQITKGTITEEARQVAIKRITAASLEEIGECDLVIEAATEHEATKIKIFQSVLPLVFGLTAPRSTTFGSVLTLFIA